MMSRLGVPQARPARANEPVAGGPKAQISNWDLGVIHCGDGHRKKTRLMVMAMVMVMVMVMVMSLMTE